MRTSPRIRSQSAKTFKEKVSKAATNAKEDKAKASGKTSNKKDTKSKKTVTKKEEPKTKTSASRGRTRSVSNTKDEKPKSSSKASTRKDPPATTGSKSKSATRKPTKAKAEPASKQSKGRTTTTKGKGKKTQKEEEKPKGRGRGRTSKEEETKDQDMDIEEPKSKAKGGKGKTTTKRSESLNKKSEKNIGSKPSKKLKKDEEEDTKKPPLTKRSSSKLDVSQLEIKVDEHCHLKNRYHVYVSGKTIYDKKLNQSNVKHNNNKYYIIQLLQSDTDPSEFYTYNRWGRVGDIQGQAVHGPFNEAKGIKEFEKKLHDKSVRGDYTVLDINYKKDEVEERQAALKGSVGQSKLHPSVASLISLIFDLKMMNDQIKSMGYDTDKMPVGKLTVKNIDDGYEVLNRINDAIKSKTAKSKLEDLSSKFYSLIPHDFGWQRMSNFVITTESQVQSKIELLDSLKDVQTAHKLADEKDTDDIAVDANYKKLKCDISCLDQKSKEYKTIEEYIKNTQEYNKLKIIDIFELDRQGEEDRFKKEWKSVGNRMLLWHGSRLANFVGIISQGLRIAPPEAPCSGYRVGKGIYLADMISKSFGYCYSYGSQGEFCILLCDAAMGKQHELLHDNCMMHQQLPKDKHSVIALGHTAPPKSSYVEITKDVFAPVGKPESTAHRNSSFSQNEYLCYNVNQVRLKYLLRMKA